MTVTSEIKLDVPPSNPDTVRPFALDEDAESVSSFPKRNMKRKRLARLVSQDELEGIAQEHRSTSPPRSVSEFDQATPSHDACRNGVPLLPNPLKNPAMLKTHIASIRLEAELHPMRLILTRLMSHQTHNRKGIFNFPVDAEGLGLADYHQIITRPMDLGTVKRRLHAIAYQSRQEAADDIRLVFKNAIQYNPPSHLVHKAATALLAYFEVAFKNLEVGDSVPEATLEQSTPMNADKSRPLHPKVVARTVSTVDDDITGDKAKQTGSVYLSEASPDFISCSLEVPKQTSALTPFLPHSCGACKGRSCQMCYQGCLFHEPALMVCHGVNCEGAKLRKGSVYYVSADGNRHYCQRCYTSLTPVLPGVSENDPCRYKQDLLKRWNNEEIAEEWLNCSKCDAGVHSICAMHNGYVHADSGYLCLDCRFHTQSTDVILSDSSLTSNDYTFVSGSDKPVSLASLGINEVYSLTAESLTECPISSFIQTKVRKRMQIMPNADKTITVRVVSDSTRQFSVPDVVRRHFRMATKSDELVKPPSQVQYRQKAITLFQKIDGMDVCIFCMYVQEYDGDHKYDESDMVDKNMSNQDKRVYIAYIDSVEHFRPRECRTEVYQEILVSYLATARARGYQTAHIWACPPSRGNSFVFWNHPSSQRTPNRDRLVSWYHGALSRAVHCGVVTDVKSLFESEFENCIDDLQEGDFDGKATKYGRMICPPLLEGDFWIEEAIRVHSTSLARYAKIRSPSDVCVWNVTPLTVSELDPCPALQIATLVKDRIMTHPASVPFRRPVNAAALKLQNYHKIVTKPMDLGTIHAQCVIGEYDNLRQVVEDVELMVSNAKIFNPVGHYVCVKADEVLALFYHELQSLVKIWNVTLGSKEESDSWESYADLSMSLDKMFDLFPVSDTAPTSVFIEDDRSSDGSRSLNSSTISAPGSPVSSGSLSKEMEEGTTVVKKQPVPRLNQSTRRGSAGKGRAKGRGRRNSSKVETHAPPRKLDLLCDGPDAVMQSMVGEDLWLLERCGATPNVAGLKTGGKRRRSSCSGSNDSVCSGEEPVTKRRRQSWVGEEVSEAVRRLRTSFFACSLLPKPSMTEAEQQKLREFDTYVAEYERWDRFSLSMSSPISDARHALLEFSQFRHFEFDTLRRAKYSTAMLLYHLKNSDAPGVVPFCSRCNETIEDVRWHKVKKATERRRVTKSMKPTATEPVFQKEELCGGCHAKHSAKEEYIPIPVSLTLGKTYAH